MTETTWQGQPAWCLENPQLKVLVSALGGRIVSLTDKDAGREVSDLSLGEERLFPSLEKFDLSTRVFTGQDSAGTAGESVLRVQYTVQRAENRFADQVAVEKEYTLPAAGAAVRLGVRLHNTGTAGRRPGMICAFRFGACKYGVYPSTSGPVVVLPAAGQTACAALAAGWFGMFRADGAGFAVLADFDNLSRPSLNAATGRLEWQCDRTDIPAGKAWSIVTWLVPTRDLPSLAYAAPDLLADIQADREQVTLRLAPSALPLAPGVAKASLVANGWVSKSELLRLDLPLPGLPLEKTVKFPAPVKEPFVVRIAVTDAGADSAFEKPSAKLAGYSIAPRLRNRLLLKPDGLTLPAERRLLIVNGLHAYHYGLTAAASQAHCPGVKEAFFKDTFYAHPPTTLSWFPESFPELFQYRVVVLASVDAASLGDTGRALLKGFVEDGGGLFVLGGPYAFGAGGYQGTFIEDMLPVRVRRTFDLVEQPAPAKRTRHGPDWLTWKDGAAQAIWLHDVEVKDEKQVWLTAGKMPLLLGGAYGKGRVVVCAGTVLGKPAPGKAGFWESPAWRDASAGVLDWLMQGPARTGRR